jgi:hypothetical protein
LLQLLIAGWDHLLMDQDDPEKRIADLERQQADAVGQPGREPARSPKRGSPGKAGWGRRLLIGLVVALFPTIFFGILVYDSYAYYVGTPTTATDVHCVGQYRHQTCTGTWSLGGESYTGEIRGAADRDGSSSDVRVYGDTAFTADVVHQVFPVGALMVGIIIVSFLVGFNYRSLRALRARAADKTASR